MPLVRGTLQLHFWSLCAPSGCLVVYTASSAGDVCELWKMLGVYKPIILMFRLRVMLEVPSRSSGAPCVVS